MVIRVLKNYCILEMAEADSKKILTLVRELHELIKNAQLQWGIPTKKPVLTGDKSQILVANGTFSFFLSFFFLKKKPKYYKCNAIYSI